MMEEYINNHFEVVEINSEKFIKWNELVFTMYEYFVNFFGDLIEGAISNGETFEELSKKMVMESLKMNYGLTELIVNHSGISIF